MENATKALLIAAAVLIAIVLIGVTMAVLDSSDTTAELDSATTSTELRAFNAQFTGYVGNSRPGSTIPTLLAAVNNSNKKNTQHDVEIIGSTDLITNASSSLRAGVDGVYAQVDAVYSVGTSYDSTAKYSITANYDAYGYIVGITIR